ncbi:putative retrotransposon hot spot (RHS) protein [Trypanosoma cruzi]|nr:putative retrotransposon hot spot (RHS) protein [Trypanosoma cruzi]
MPPKQNRVQGGNARSRASAVPQGDRQRRARQDFEGERDQPAATNIRAESQQPQWTMSSSVEDILLEGSTNRNNMKLNDFLRSYLGEEWVVERNGNVTMEAFVQEPDAYVQDQQLLRRIVNLTAYQTLKILLEAINKLHHEGVYSLEQWRDYEGKDTVTPVARRKLNAAISRVLTEERRKAEERREAEERARRDQQQIIFNLSAMIEDLLFGGRVRVHKMKLNDFLTMEFDGRGILRANRCVWLGDFFKDPTRYIRDAGVLNEIQATGAYARMEMTVREEMDLEEDVHRLHHEGVYSLEQWRDYEGKDTVTPVARRKINAAISRVLTEERRKAEERRETKERASRRQKLELTVTTTIKDVLFRGRVRVMDIQLNDFLVMELDGMGILPANRNVLLKEFVKDSTRYICGAFLLLEIKASDRYKRMERAVRDEMDMEEDVNKLYEKGVDNLLKWSLAAEEVKANVHNLTKHFLDAAFIELMSSMTMSAPMKLEGCYESVYNARWHHVVEVPGGKGAGMYVREGEPEQSWKYKEVGEFLEKDDGVEQSGAARPRLMVLTSDRGWPYSWKEDESTRDCYVNSEVERVWRIVRNDLTEWFSPHRGTYFTPKQRLLIGTPGIGKSLAAGSYLLYQLLHYDAEQLPMVAYVIGSQSFLFDKTTKTVSTYRDNPRIEDVVNIFFSVGLKGIVSTMRHWHVVNRLLVCLARDGA